MVCSFAAAVDAVLMSWLEGEESEDGCEWGVRVNIRGWVGGEG